MKTPMKLALITLVLLIAFLLTSCTVVHEPHKPRNDAGAPGGTRRFVDEEYGIVCFVIELNISCVKAEVGSAK